MSQEGGHTLRYGIRGGDVGPRMVQQPTQKGKARNQIQQAQHGVEGSAPHRAEAFVAMQRDEERKQGIPNLQTSQ